MILEETYTPADGAAIPELGLGTWFIRNNDVVQAGKEAARIGNRLVDIAQAYRNQSGVVDGIRASPVDREDMFIATKLAAEVKSYEEAVSSIDISLETMGLDHVDMMIINSPQPWSEYGEEERYLEGNREAWRALEDAYRAGTLRAIGGSNFEKPDIENIIESGSVQPMVNRILSHIGNTPKELIQYTQGEGILVTAHSPLGHGESLKNEEIA